jgi:hypothetical protein
MGVLASMRGGLSAQSDVLFRHVEEAESSIIRRGIAYWRELRDGRNFPDRSQVTLRGLGRLAKHAVLVQVIDNGADYEFRFVGSEPVGAVGWNFQGRRMSEPDIHSVMRANYRRQLYDKVVHTGEPWLFKCRLVDHVSLRLPVRSETVFLPMGRRDEAVDHLLGFTVFAASD